MTLMDIAADQWRTTYARDSLIALSSEVSLGVARVFNDTPTVSFRVRNAGLNAIVIDVQGDLSGEDKWQLTACTNGLTSNARYERLLSLFIPTTHWTCNSDDYFTSYLFPESMGYRKPLWRLEYAHSLLFSEITHQDLENNHHVGLLERCQTLSHHSLYYDQLHGIQDQLISSASISGLELAQDRIRILKSSLTPEEVSRVTFTIKVKVDLATGSMDYRVIVQQHPDSISPIGEHTFNSLQLRKTFNESLKAHPSRGSPRFDFESEVYAPHHPTREPP